MTDKNSGIDFVIRQFCAVLFCLFSFIYLYFFQADIIAYGQHVLSHGQTYYNRHIGAFLITLVLYLLALIVRQFTSVIFKHREPSYLHALTYLPSCYVLGRITHVSIGMDNSFSWGLYMLALCAVLVVYGLLALGVKFIIELISTDETLPMTNARKFWMNIMWATGLFIMTGAMGNSNDVLHYRLAAERHIAKEEYDKALLVGEKSLVKDSSLTMLRAFALSKQGQLAERLFEYPLIGGSEALRPHKNVRFLMLPLKTFYRVGQTPKDYILIGYLLDCKIDAFASNIGKYYHINDSLPKHYREALILYKHLRSNPKVVYQNAVLDADFKDLMDMQKKYPERRSRINAIIDSYWNTYWAYYFVNRLSSR